MAHKSNSYLFKFTLSGKLTLKNEDREMSKERHKYHIENITLREVPLNERKHWFGIALVQAGIVVCVPALMLGGILVNGMPLWKAVLSGSIGYVIVIALYTLQAVQGNDLGVPSSIVSAKTFGYKASKYIVSVLMAISMLGWFAVQANICGSAFSMLFKGSFDLNIPIWLSTIIWGIVMLLTAAKGIDSLRTLNYIAIPSLFLLSLYGVIVSIYSYGFSPLLTYMPNDSISFTEGIIYTIGSSVVGIVAIADITRYQSGRKDTVKSTVIGILPASIIMMIIGAVLAIVAGTYDICDVLAKIGVPVIGMLILILSTWTTNTSNAYCAGIDLVMILGTSDSKRARLTMISGILGTVIGAMGIVSYFTAFLNMISIVFLPITGVMIADYWIRHKGKSSNFGTDNDYDICAVAASVFGIGVSLISNIDSSALNGFAASVVAFLIFKRISENKIFKQANKKHNY